MPKSPMKPCKYGGCPNLTRGSFCEEHKQTENRRYNKYQRNPNSAKRYGKEWKVTSKAYRKANPLCEMCMETERLVPAECVHHKQALADGGTNECENLQALCNACHSKLHAEQGDRWHNLKT